MCTYTYTHTPTLSSTALANSTQKKEWSTDTHLQQGPPWPHLYSFPPARCPSPPHPTHKVVRAVVSPNKSRWRQWPLLFCRSWFSICSRSLSLLRKLESDSSPTLAFLPFLSRLGRPKRPNRPNLGPSMGSSPWGSFLVLAPSQLPVSFLSSHLSQTNPNSPNLNFPLPQLS